MCFLTSFTVYGPSPLLCQSCYSYRDLLQNLFQNVAICQYRRSDAPPVTLESGLVSWGRGGSTSHHRYLVELNPQRTRKERSAVDHLFLFMILKQLAQQIFINFILFFGATAEVISPSISLFCILLCFIFHYAFTLTFYLLYIVRVLNQTYL